MNTVRICWLVGLAVAQLVCVGCGEANRVPKRSDTQRSISEASQGAERQTVDVKPKPKTPSMPIDAADREVQRSGRVASNEPTKPLEAASSSKRPPVAMTGGAGEFRGPRDVIVEGRLTVDVMEVVPPPRVDELAQRLQRAIVENPNWWREHMKKGKPGEPLPYDSRCGISKAEYDEFLALSNKWTTRKKSEATLVIATKDDGVYSFDGGQALPDFTGVEIDLENDLVRTPFGVLTERSEIHATEDSSLGAWDGTQWKLVKRGANGIIAKLAIGRLKQSGRCIIYYDMRKILPDGKSGMSHILNYDLPPKE